MGWQQKAFNLASVLTPVSFLGALPLVLINSSSGPYFYCLFIQSGCKKICMRGAWATCPPPPSHSCGSKVTKLVSVQTRGTWMWPRDCINPDIPHILKFIIVLLIMAFKIFCPVTVTRLGCRDNVARLKSFLQTGGFDPNHRRICLNGPLSKLRIMDYSQ